MVDTTKPTEKLTLEEVRELRFGDVLMAWYSDEAEPHLMVVVEDVKPEDTHLDVVVRFADFDNSAGNHKIETEWFEYWGEIRLVSAPSERPFTIGDRVVFAEGKETSQHTVTASNLYKDGCMYYQLDGGKLSNVTHESLRLAPFEVEQLQPNDEDALADDSEDDDEDEDALADDSEDDDEDEDFDL